MDSRCGELPRQALPSIGIELPRYACVLIFGVCPTLPLCLLKDLAMLSYSSAVAVVATLYTTVVPCSGWRRAVCQAGLGKWL